MMDARQDTSLVLTRPKGVEHVDPLLAKLPEFEALLVGASMAILLAGIRTIVERRRLYLPFLGVKLGYCLGMPLFALKAARYFKKHPPQEGWYDRRDVLAAILAAWAALGIRNYLEGVKTGYLPEFMRNAPSEHAHTAYFPFLMTVISHAVLSILREEDITREELETLAPLALVAIGFILDQLSDGPTVVPSNR